MNPEFENQWETEIDRHLKDLPDLAAPPNLIPQTLNALTRPEAPWYARPWQAWPAGLRVAYFVVTFGAIVAAIPGWRAFGPRLVAPVVARLAQWRTGVEVLWNAVSALAGAGAVVVDHFGKGVIVSSVLVVILAYATCVGFGTVFVRLARSGLGKNQL